MRQTLGVLLVIATLSGCTDAAPDAAAASAEPDSPPTVHDLLNATAHVRVDDPTTLEFSFASASERAPRIATTLIHLTKAVDTVHLAMDGRPLLIALIPRAAATTACGDLPNATHADFRPMTHGPSAANLTDAYEPGWYHAVVVADRTATVRLTFGADEPVDPTSWRTDTTISPAVRSLTSGHQVGVGLGDDGKPWFAWLGYGVDGSTLDAGGERTLRVGDDCAADTVTAGPTALAVAGNGSASANVLARYTPNQPAVAPETTTLTVVEITFKPLEPPMPEPSTTPTETTVAA